MTTRPGTPRLLRELNDRAALELLVRSGPLTRAQIGEQTGLSKVTASQLLTRLEERGLVEVVGQQGGGRGPSALLYGVNPVSAYVAGLDVGPDTVTVGIADITGAVAAEITVDPNGDADPVRVVHEAVTRACDTAGIAESRLRAVVIGTPGVVDPRTGDVQFVFDLPQWHEGVLDALRNDLRRPVRIENDVNLVTVAEAEYGFGGRAGAGSGDFALVWIDRGVGLGVMIGGRLHRGLSGAAGEIGYLPVPGVGLPNTIRESASTGLPALGGGFGSLVSADAVLDLARTHGIDAATATDAVTAAVDGSVDAFLDELALRISYGVAAVNIVLDPGALVLAGALGRAGGADLADRVAREVGRISPTEPTVTPSEVTGNPVLRGALHAAVDRARDEVFSG
ncbi:putative NBD/HSP70 family sugar kinase [Herbihabitans rhizosphaerae]|uniref:Putative NBD/HSP70 family sugar kinase n=1 Tax=Herbihabitans rhizosphaerae TaxID=1872711 RepID=A0A4Q7KST9_9PSEU|nr:ROK family transcriptional regulator [Herbihabitans rhizosphaerae]RZS39200.1 putative NBD/HSP70 family sugar kinase [Herbihabitans rhizosphaerae]